MKNQQGVPEALRLADALDNSTSPWTGERVMFAEAAAELRRLHAENERLSGLCDKWNSECDEFREDNKRLAALVDAQHPAPSAAATTPLAEWRWVPTEPTEAMFTLFSQQIEEGVVYVGGFLNAYRCMLDAAPQPSPTPQADSQPAPIDMVLHCPKCGLQHIDTPEKVDRRLAVIDPPAAWAMDPWNNPPHRSHLCHGCGHIWRPADVPTNGVAAVKTTGKADSPIAARAPANQQLFKFYGDTTDAELIAAQARHIERLQAKLPQTPSFAPQRVREG